MLELVLKLIDYVKSLAERSEVNRRRLHDDFVLPIYQALEESHTDHERWIAEMTAEATSPDATTDGWFEGYLRKAEAMQVQDHSPLYRLEISLSTLKGHEVSRAFVNTIHDYIKAQSMHAFLSAPDTWATTKRAQLARKYRDSGTFEDCIMYVIRGLQQREQALYVAAVHEYVQLKLELLTPKEIRTKSKA